MTDELEKLLTERISTIDAMAARHTPERRLCSCGRPLPCSVAQVFAERRHDFEQQLDALIGPTTVLAVIARRGDRSPTPSFESQPRRRRWIISIGLETARSREPVTLVPRVMKWLGSYGPGS